MTDDLLKRIQLSQLLQLYNQTLPFQVENNFLNNMPLIKAKGALFYRIFGYKACLLSFVFSFRKYKLAKIGLIKFYKLMIDGISNYKKNKAKK